MNAVLTDKAKTFHAYNRVDVLRGWPLLSVHSASWDSIIHAAARLTWQNLDAAKQLTEVASNLNQ